MHTFPGPDSLTYSVISNLMCNTVDYCAISALHRVLPLEDKVIKLKVTEEDYKELAHILNGFDIENAVLIHAGRHWESKTFPILKVKLKNY